MTRPTLFLRLSFVSLWVPLTLAVLGCPGDPLDGTAGSPPKTTANQTAPAVASKTNPTGATKNPAQKTTTNAATQTNTGMVKAGPLQQTQQPAAAAVQVPALTPQQQATELARQQRAQNLINQSEASYNSGVQNYRANRLDAARLDFDTAVDTLLASGLDLKAEGPAADEFDRLLNAINALEMDALKQGNGFSPKIEEAPLEAAADLTFAPNPELVAKLKTELNVTSDLPLVINDQVAGYINVFSGSSSFRAHMAASLQRVGKYRGLIQSVLKQEGVPQDLIYLAVAESGFQPQVVNARSGAGGMWQFMTFTGTQYNLTRNGYFDYRFDPEKSSRAYARYIKALYEQFGDWYLAMAAYNWGPGNIQRAVQRTGYADFWELYRRNAMPAETRAYVPQILAAVIMAKNPEKYGLDKLTPSPPVIYDTVSVDYAIDMKLVADVTNSTVPEIVELNPSLLRLTTPSDMSFDLHLPPGTKQLFMDRLKDIPEDRRASWRFHVVKPGETLESIATNLHAKAADIAETNGITAADPMSVDDELVIPVQSFSARSNPQRYTTRRGDTLLTVADRFNVSVEELRRWNTLSSATLTPGRTLNVAEPVRLAHASRSRSRATGRSTGRLTGRIAGRAAGRMGGRVSPSRAASGAVLRGSRATSGSRSTRGSGSLSKGSSAGSAKTQPRRSGRKATK
jgi:membrane-bound lytic murein transglycosylase D